MLKLTVLGVPTGLPLAFCPWLVADKFTGELEGQYQGEICPLQVAMPVVAVSRKKSPFEPLSKKLSGYVTPLKVVMTIPILVPLSGTARTVAPPTPLFDWVPMPKIRLPLGSSEPPLGTAGN